MMKKSLFAAALLTASMSTSAGTVVDFLSTYSGGTLSFTGTTTLSVGNVVSASLQHPAVMSAFGSIDRIADAAGNTIWTTGQLGSYLSYTLTNANVADSISLGHGAFSFTGNGGEVDYFLSSTSIVPASTTAVSAGISQITSQGDNFLSTFGTDQSTGFANNPTGFFAGSTNMSVDQSLLAQKFNSNHFNGDDFQVTVSGNSERLTAGRPVIGSFAATGFANPNAIPEPTTLVLLGLGLLAAVFSKKHV